MRTVTAFRTAMIFASLLLCGTAGGQLGTQLQPFPPKKKPAQPPDPKVEKVQKMLDDIWDVVLKPAPKRIEARRPLMEMGEEAFPAFEAILADPDSKPQHVRGTLEILVAMKSDRRGRFIDLVLGRLTDESPTLRWKALVLLGEIGSERDTGPVIALLSDKDVRFTAADTLVKIGGQRDLVAMAVWLRAVSPPAKDDNFFWHVKKCRELLEERLNEKPDPKTVKD